MKWSGKSNRTLLAVAALAVAVSTCSYKQHNAETRDIPEALYITSNLGETGHEFRITVQTSFYALKEHWYCTEWGNAGLGNPPQSLLIRDTLLSATDTLVVPLRVLRKTFCPYVLEYVLVDVEPRQGKWTCSSVTFSTDTTYPVLAKREILDIGYTMPNKSDVDYCQSPQWRRRLPEGEERVYLNFRIQKDACNEQE